MGIKPGPYKRVYSRQDDLFQKETPFIPKNTCAILREKSIELGLPISRLIAIAIDNELDQPEPFNYPVDLPDTYTEYLYAKECASILKCLQKAPTGLGRDMLVLARRDLGIADRAVLLVCLRELYDKGLAEEIRPLRPKFGYFHKAYRYVRACGVARQKHKYKRVEGVRQGRRITDDQVTDEEDNQPEE